jgi:hypothetical protein
MKNWMVCCACLVGFGLTVCPPAPAAELFPYRMPWDDTQANLTNLSDWNPKPAGKAGFVHIKDGHLYVGTERLRLLGVNIVFGSAAPAHADADRIAARLARFGINIVRLHHMDSHPAPDGLLQKDRQTLDPQAMDRLDYFIAALKREGIYSDLNLHVGRRYPGFTPWEPDAPLYWKGVDNFFPPMVALQRDYAHDLLTHRNPYTGNRYSEEPAIALIEINNENGLLREWRVGALNNMNEPFRSELQRQWITWLHQHYANDAALKQAWGLREEALGNEMLAPAINVRNREAGWNLQVVGDARASLQQADDQSLDLAMTHTGQETWHIQIHQNQLAFAAEQPYTLSLRLRADHPMRIGLQAMQAHAPWQSLWSQDLQVGTDWQDYRLTFAPSGGDKDARLTIGRLGQVTGHLFVQSASLRPGGVLGLKSGESLAAGTVGILDSSTLMSRTPAGQRDWLQFLWDTERAYWQGMRDYVRNDLGAHSLIVGTQVSYSPAPIQSLFDVVDGHAYWQHPSFPGKPWDIDNWRIANTPMAGIDGAGTLADLALRRMPGKPFIVTEYNHPFPSLYQGEALPLVAAYGALQDWDGVFLYSYGSHTKTWDSGVIGNFFDSHANPVKMSSLIAAAALLRRADVQAARPLAQPLPTEAVWLDALRGYARIPGADAFGAVRNESLLHQVSIATPRGPDVPLPVRSETGELLWGLKGVGGGRTVVIDTPRSKGLIGARLGRPDDLHGVQMEITEARNNWGILMATVMDGQDFVSPGHILVSALGQSENSGQKWLDDKKTSIGRNFGKAPVLVEGISARFCLPLPAERVRAWALDETGMRREAVPVTGGKQAIVDIAPRFHSLWYELEIR